MTATLETLRCFKPGQRVNTEQIMERTGLSRDKVGGALWRLLKAKQIVRVRWGIYALNPDAPPLPKAMVVVLSPLGCRGHIGVKPARKPPPPPKPVKAPVIYRPEGNTAVARALAKRSPLESCWGGL